MLKKGLKKAKKWVLKKSKKIIEYNSGKLKDIVKNPK